MSGSAGDDIGSFGTSIILQILHEQLLDLEVCACLSVARSSRNPTVETAYQNLLVAVKLAEDERVEARKREFEGLVSVLRTNAAPSWGARIMRFFQHWAANLKDAVTWR